MLKWFVLGRRRCHIVTERSFKLDRMWIIDRIELQQIILSW